MKRISIKIGHLIWSFFLFLGRKSNGLEKNIITINDTRYAYLAPSTVDPEFETIVLIHGFTGFKEYWSDFMRSCRGKLNFIVIDLPGHGESGFDHETSFQKQTSALVHEVICRSQIKTAHFVGASVGAWVACLFAMESPSYVKTLTLIGPVGVPATSSSEFFSLVDEGKNPFWATTQQEYTHLLGLALKNPPPEFWPLSNFLLADYAKRQPIYKHIWQQITDSDQRVLPIDLARLSELPCSKHVIMGDEERTIHHSILKKLTDQVSGIGVHQCPESGHSVQCDQPKWLADLVRTEVIGSS